MIILKHKLDSVMSVLKILQWLSILLRVKAQNFWTAFQIFLKLDLPTHRFSDSIALFLIPALLSFSHMDSATFK